MKFENLLYNDLHWKNLSDWTTRIVRHERVDNSNLERVTLSPSDGIDSLQRNDKMLLIRNSFSSVL